MAERQGNDDSGAIGNPLYSQPSSNRPPAFADDEPPRRIEIKLADGKERTIRRIAATSFWGPDGRPMSAADFIEKLFGDLPELRPVWDGAAFQPTPMAPLDLTYDHRVINGADAARFLTRYRDLIANPDELLLARALSHSPGFSHSGCYERSAAGALVASFIIPPLGFKARTAAPADEGASEPPRHRRGRGGVAPATPAGGGRREAVRDIFEPLGDNPRPVAQNEDPGRGFGARRVMSTNMVSPS